MPIQRLKHALASLMRGSRSQGGEEVRAPLSPAELHSYWRQERPEHHDPVAALAHTERSAVLLRLFPGGASGVHKDSPILELGSGGGRNLAFLHDAGFTQVEGVEISQAAVDLARRTYPQLQQVTIHVGALEEVLPKLPSDGYRLVFSMGTLQHIHPDSRDVFENVARLSSNVLVIEGPPQQRRRRFPHDFENIFASLGMSATRKPVSLRRLLPEGDALRHYRAQLYQRMDNLDSLRAFWTQPAPQANTPASYTNPIGRSKALLKLVSDLPKDARILEVGCNVGRNLAYLHDHGYTRVQGVEINPHAVELLRETYPQLADVQVHVGPAGDVLPGIEDDQFDLVFTMAVIEHIHPDESSVFDHMVRLGTEVLAIEPKGRRTHRQFPHDVVDLFTSRGMTQVSETWMGEFKEEGIFEAMQHYTAYRFRRQ